MTVVTLREARVYRNLHKAMYSVQHRIPGRGWRVAGHRTVVYLTDATFEVSEAGRRRVLATKKKNVHAFVRGRYMGPAFVEPEVMRELGAVPIAYNPYKGATFTDRNTGAPILGAQHVWLTQGGVWAKGVTYAPAA